MSAFKGTAGPWEHAPIAYNGQISVIITKDWNVALCCDNLKGGRAEQTANAALIAQAPAMLEALQNVVADLDIVVGEAQKIRDLAPETIDKIDAILAALREGGAI